MISLDNRFSFFFESGCFTEVSHILYFVFQKGTVDEDMAPASVVTFTKGSYLKVSKGAKIRNRYNQVPHLTQDTNGKVTNSQ